MSYRQEADVASGSDRIAHITRVLWVILFLNVGVALAKLTWGILTHSAAMQADGFHSMFDGTSNVVGLVALSFAARPADADHPYGHGKYETYASTIIGVMLVLAAWRVGSSAVGELMSPEGLQRVQVGPISFAVMLGTLAVNIVITVWERRVGRRYGSQILIADASHTGSDILVSLGVIVSLVLVWVGEHFGISWMRFADPVVAIGVALAIAWTAFEIFKASSATFSDSARMSRDQICRAVLAVPGVLGCHHIRTRGAEAEVYIDLHVQVDSQRTVADGHAIAESVERMLVEEFDPIVDAIVHLEPYDDYQAEKTAAETETGDE